MTRGTGRTFPTGRTAHASGRVTTPEDNAGGGANRQSTNLVRSSRDLHVPGATIAAYQCGVSMNQQLVNLKETSRGISQVELSRPDRRNALSIELLDALSETLTALAADPTNRVVILTGAGPVFSAGLDLRQAADESLTERSATAIESTLRLVRSIPLITIAAVRGGALAGGAGLMAACDLVIAAENAQVGFPEARRGLLPALICDVLRMRVREGDLRDLFLTGDAVSAARAREMGLVQRVVPAAELMQHAVAAAESIVSGGPDTIRRTKQLLNSVYFTTSQAATDEMARLHREARHSPEAREGLQAFLDRRDPVWVDAN